MSRVRAPSIAHLSMTLWHALLLGLLQGITEFLPISSSGHLLLAEWILQLTHVPELTLFNLFCHIGTLAALVWCLRDALYEILYTPSYRWLFVAALLPLCLAFPLIPPLRSLFTDPLWLGIGFLITSALLTISSLLPKGNERYPSRLEAFAIGMGQIAALFPGVSRSGSTIAIGRLTGLSYRAALSFSFLLSIPTVLSGVVLEIRHHPSWDFLPYSLVGATAAFLTGCFTVSLLLRIAQAGTFRLLAVYCALLGLTVLYFYG